jgi:hypothetical protein
LESGCRNLETASHRSERIRQLTHKASTLAVRLAGVWLGARAIINSFGSLYSGARDCPLNADCTAVLNEYITCRDLWMNMLCLTVYNNNDTALLNCQFVMMSKFIAVCGATSQLCGSVARRMLKECWREYEQ